MAATLDQELIRISDELGCTADERIIAIAQSNEAYRKTTGAVEWSGGQFDGKIRVPVFDGRTLSAETRKVLAHETAHACLSTIGQWPAWLHEGIAQKVSGETLPPAARQKIAALVRDGKVPTLEELGQNWSRFDTEQAVIAYAMALNAVELFYKDGYGIQNLLRNPQRLPEITADLDRKLAQQK
jgi:hypothetical protein